MSKAAEGAFAAHYEPRIVCLLRIHQQRRPFYAGWMDSPIVLATAELAYLMRPVRGFG